MSGDRCPIGRFGIAVARSAQRAGATITIADHRARPWHSATFAGHRHMVEASAMSGAALDQWLAAIEDMDLAMPGQMLAELRVTALHHTAGVTRFALSGLTVTAG